MKKTLIASAIALTSIAATNANANLSVTQMNFSGISAASGSINDDGTLGSFTGSFFGHTWLATQETGMITTGNGSWAGTNALGSWDYTDAINGMAATHIAVGTFFDWNGNEDIAVLAIFDCNDVAGTCTGVNTNPDQGMQTGPFVGAAPAFNGQGNLSAVPVPAAVWLMGSGLLGLVGVARRRKAA